MQLSLELVPRSIDNLKQQLSIAAQYANRFHRTNLPDLKRFELRSWDAARISREHFKQVVPHIRAIDFDINNPTALFKIIEDYNFEEVLLVKGDLPTDRSVRVYPTSTLDLIQAVREHFPEIKIYAAFDPYRSSLREELAYIKQKVNAGADGFFSQPFFDMRLIEVYAEHVNLQSVYWGVSPVMSDGSKNYWQTTNRAIFPRSFEPTMDWNVNFFKEVLEFCQRAESNCYLMPIRLNLAEFLRKSFE